MLTRRIIVLSFLHVHLLKEKEKAARDAQIASMKVGTVLKGTVETLQNYGAFVKLENGL